MPLPRFADYSLRFLTPISLGLAIYYHYQSVQERVPTFYVSPTRARIVDTSIPAPPQLQVLFKGKDLNANVSAVVLYFWNDGKLPIKAEDVLEPLKIELDPSCEIIDARVLKISRAVTKFAKGDVSDTAKNVLPVSFGILERNDGAQLQIIYTGRPDARVSLSGTIVGAGQTRESTTLQDRRPTKSKFKLLLLFTLLAALVTFGTLILSRHSRWVRDERPPGRPLRFLFALALFLTMTIPAVVIVVYDAWKSQPAVPSTIWTENQK